MELFSDKFRFFGSLFFIAIAFFLIFSIWSSPPSLAYLAILIFGVFAWILTVLWILFLIKTKYGQLLLIVNSISSGFSIYTILTTRKDFHPDIILAGIVISIFATVATLVLGTIHFSAMSKIENQIRSTDILDNDL